MTEAPAPDNRPLSGIRVVDLTRVMTGPYCTMMLGDLGADVVKIEQPGKGDDTRAWGPPFVGSESAYFLSVNRNKRSVALDLKDEADVAAARELAGRADVLVENFKPGGLARFGLDYDSVRALRRIQKIIHVTNPTAMIDSEPPRASWASNVRACSVRVRPRVTPTLTSTAIATPSQTLGSSERRFVRTRKATRMLTTSDASSPSRSPMRALLANIVLPSGSGA